MLCFGRFWVRDLPFPNARRLGRNQELSVRLALGATRASLLRQLATQAMIFAVIGGALGLAFGKLALAFFVHRFPNAFLRFQETNIDGRVVLVTLVMTLLASLIAALLPALYTLHLNAGSPLTGQWSSLVRPRFRAVGRARWSSSRYRWRLRSRWSPGGCLIHENQFHQCHLC